MKILLTCGYLLQILETLLTMEERSQITTLMVCIVAIFILSFVYIYIYIYIYLFIYLFIDLGMCGNHTCYCFYSTSAWPYEFFCFGISSS